jgi:hypothetical protein
VGEPTRATLHAILVEGMVDAEVAAVLSNMIVPRRKPWRMRVRQLLRMGGEYKEYVRL